MKSSGRYEFTEDSDDLVHPLSDQCFHCLHEALGLSLPTEHPAMIAVIRLQSLHGTPPFYNTIVGVQANFCWLVGCVGFYGPSTHFRTFQAQSVNLATLFLGKPPRQFTST